MREIVFYRTRSGSCPVEEFLDSLSSKQAQKAAWVLQLIEEIDNAPSQYFKKMVNTDDLWEGRIQSGGNIFRILGFFSGNDLVVLNHGFQKKTQKTPRKAIKLAEERKKDYLNRDIS
jgi:phage-related protein